MVPMLTCGLVRSNFAFATGLSSWTSFAYAETTFPSRRFVRVDVRIPGKPGETALTVRCSGSGSFSRCLRDDLLRDVRRNLRVGVELHGVVRSTLGLRPQVA